MRILYAASEAAPFAKSGGLADVAGALPKALVKDGVDARVIMPLYGDLKFRDTLEYVTNYSVPVGWRSQYCGLFKTERNGVTYYFLDNEYYFKRRGLYGFYDDGERFAFFSRAVLETLFYIDFTPDIINCNDWQTALVPVYLNLYYRHLDKFNRIKTIFTIHNIAYQGKYGTDILEDTCGIGHRDQHIVEYDGCANFMKGAFETADKITTVSPSYAEEIQTAYYGERLDGLLRARRNSLSGVLNGIDMQEYDPAADPLIPAPYSAQDLSGRAQCKAALQQSLGLTVDPSVPIIGMVGRLSSQKGLDLVDHVIGQIMEENVQLVVLGMGESRYVNLFSWAEQQYPGRVAARFQMDHQLAHRIYAGADMFLMPSKSEPCGLSQLIAMHYGTVPIVASTGGLRDTVPPYNPETGEGRGFTFQSYNADDFLGAIDRAAGLYYGDRDAWNRLARHDMECDFSWQVPANEYMQLYSELLYGKQ